MPVRRHFLPWGRPLLPQAVEFLAGDWKGGGPLDLSGLLVVVPTRQAGRRLREGLAEFAARRGQAVFPPQVLTPEALLAPGPDGPAASRLESLVAWAEALRAADPASCREVFPVDPPARGWTWALRVADGLLRVQAALAEAGLRLGGVADRAGGDFPERERWEQLGRLERDYDARLRTRGRRDPQAAKIAGAKNPAGLPGVAKIVLLGTPDPMPLAVTALAAHARTLPIEVAVFAPPAEAASFDDWGRPAPSAWESRALDLPDFEQRVRLCADPAAQADEIAAAARGYGSSDGLLAIGAADGEVLAALESALGRAGFETFNPEGRPRRGEALHPLLAALAALAREPAFETVEALGRCPAFLDFLRARRGGDFSPVRWLAGLDELRARHLPEDLSAALGRAESLREFPEVAAGLAAIEELRAALGSGPFAAGAARALETIFAGVRWDLARPSEARLAEAAGAWREVVRDCAAAAAGLPAPEAWDLALRLFGDEAAAGAKPEGALELQGWLELLWEDAPHLAVAGFNDGSVPEAVAGDPFLPESLRERLGLKTNASRLGRDAYLLQAMAACRSGRGRLDLLLGKTSAAGDPLKPSRLLLRCAERELPARAQFLFRPLGLARPQPPWTRAWKLVPPEVPPPPGVAVTALRDWLACPFRFYLRRVLRMAPVDAAKGELDDLDFGTLCHEVLEAMGGDPRWRDCADAGELREFLSAELDRRVRGRFGEDLALPLVIQREAARQRLGQAAARQARERAAGWRIAEVEKKIALEIGGLVVSGKVDRIDRHADTGAVRLLDYKTSDRPRSPEEVHLRRPRRGETPPDWARCEPGGHPRVWADLQLPFYRLGLAAEFPSGMSCGYFNLPKAAGETGLALWEDYPPELHEAAVRCAEGVCAAIRRGDFWPPNEEIRPDEDDFAALFHRGAAASVDWGARRR